MLHIPAVNGGMVLLLPRGTMGFARTIERTLSATLLLAVLGMAGGDCARGGRGDTPRCGPCTRTSQCRRGLSCVNGNCQTAPPTCHVDFGI